MIGLAGPVGVLALDVADERRTRRVGPELGRECPFDRMAEGLSSQGLVRWRENAYPDPMMNVYVSPSSESVG